MTRFWLNGMMRTEGGQNVEGTRDWGTLAVASWGALTGTVSALWNLRQWWVDRVRVHVTAMVGRELGRPETGSHFIITVTNVGRRPITIELVGIRLPKRAQYPHLMINDDVLPALLEEAMTITVKVSAAFLDKYDLTAPFDTVWAKDTLGRLHFPLVPPWRRLRRWWWLTWGRPPSQPTDRSIASPGPSL